MEFRDLGVHHLRGLTRLERVFQLVAPGLGQSFLSCARWARTPSNLPVQVTSFVGRDDERTALATLVREHRLVTIIGVGGVGKTRLALEVAADVVGDHRDGAWLCELAPAADVDAMVDLLASRSVSSIGQMCAARERARFPLHQADLLLVLDNCEHLLDPAAELAADVLQRCAGASASLRPAASR